MTPEASFDADNVFIQEVIICTKKRRGNGSSSDNPIRIITEVFTKDGKLIAEYDPHKEVKWNHLQP